MAKTYWLEKDELFNAAKNRLEKVETLLDIGCGINPQTLTVPRVHICAEPFHQYIEHLNKKIKTFFDNRTFVVIQSDWKDICKALSDKSVDTVILSDVIEHIDKKEAKKLLKATEKIAKKQIAIFTPLGFVPQDHEGGKDAWGLDGAEWQKHRSGWEPKDFDNTWEVYVSKEFHLTDNMNRKLEKPWGAIWAIKTFKKVNDPPRIKRAKQHLEDSAISSNSVLGVRVATLFFNLITTSKKIIWSITKNFLPKKEKE